MNHKQAKVSDFYTSNPWGFASLNLDGFPPSKLTVLNLKVDTKMVRFHPNQTRHQDEGNDSKILWVWYSKTHGSPSHQFHKMLVFLAPRTHSRFTPCFYPKPKSFSWTFLPPKHSAKRKKMGENLHNSPLFTLQKNRRP